jgi:hypothetical protein
MRPQERLVAAAPNVGELASDSKAGELLSLIDAIEQKLALAREAVKAHVRASAGGSGTGLQPVDQSNGARPARPTPDLIGDALRKD